MLELKEAYEKDVRKQLFGHTIRMEDIEDTLLYLSRIEALQIEGGFLVLYNRLQIDRLVLNNKSNINRMIIINSNCFMPIRSSRLILSVNMYGKCFPVIAMHWNLLTTISN